MGVTLDPVVWHDVECGSYAADLPLWRDLAGDHGPILDLGAGTGRVALDLARAGHDVHALDVDPALLDALAERAASLGVPVATHVADAREFDLGDLRFALVLAPMQTVQLLGGPAARASMLASVRRHLGPGGRFAAALANTVEPFQEGEVAAPVPDMREVDGIVYASRPTAIRADPTGFTLERIREKVATDGRREVSGDEIHLDRVPAELLEAEARAAGLTALPRRAVAETADHVGSEVVVLRG